MDRGTRAVMGLLLCPAWIAAQTPPDTISLSFDWPVGMAAHVTGFRYRAQDAGLRGDTTRSDFSITVTQESRTSMEGNGLEVAASQTRVRFCAYDYAWAGRPR